jgi:hypothetical protein
MYIIKIRWKSYFFFLFQFLWLIHSRQVIDSCLLCARSAFGRLATACVIHTHMHMHLCWGWRRKHSYKLRYSYTITIISYRLIYVHVLKNWKPFDLFMKKTHRFIEISNQSVIFVSISVYILWQLIIYTKMCASNFSIM